MTTIPTQVEIYAEKNQAKPGATLQTVYCRTCKKMISALHPKRTWGTKADGQRYYVDKIRCPTCLSITPKFVGSSTQVTTTCAECGLPFRYNPKEKIPVTCSPLCRNKYANRITRRAIDCATCGHKFIVKSNRQKYCSKICTTQARLDRLVKKSAHGLLRPNGPLQP